MLPRDTKAMVSPVSFTDAKDPDLEGVRPDYHDDNDDDEDDDDVDEEKEEEMEMELQLGAEDGASPSKMQQQEQAKCNSCGKITRKDCAQSLCVKCCVDDECLVHEQQRVQAAWREEVLNGTTDIQLEAKEKRRKLLPKGRFREPGFVYLGDTVVIWDIRQCLLPEPAKTDGSSGNENNNNNNNNSKTKDGSTVIDDILNRARKRKRSREGQKVLRNNRKRFRRVIEDLYRQSLL